MGNPIEAGRAIIHAGAERTARVRSLIANSYIGHLIGETSGISTYRRYEIADDFKPLGRGVGGTFAVLSLQFPLLVRGFAASHFDHDSDLISFLKLPMGMLVDMGISAVIASHTASIQEFLAYRTALNFGSHALVDAIRSGVNHLRGFRPPPSTAILAV